MKTTTNTETHTLTLTYTRTHTVAQRVQLPFQSESLEHNTTKHNAHRMWQGYKVNEVSEALLSSSLPSALLLRLSLLLILSILAYLYFFQIPV